MATDRTPPVVNEDVSFERWKTAVDLAVQAATGGMGCDDLPDVDYRSLHEEGDTPAEAAQYVVQHAM